MQLQPREYYPIFRKLSDHTDTNTYYVQAVIYNARTNALIGTVNLTDNGSGDFSKDWQTPSDSSGLGLYIKIITSVYTDSGYTTKSPNYGDEGQILLIQDRFANMGGGGGAYVDYKKIEGFIKNEIANLPKPEPVKETDLQPIISRLENIEESLNNIEIPAQEKTDLSQVLQAISETLREVKNIEIPEQKETDLSPVMKKLDSLDFDKTNENLDSLLERIRQYFDKDMGKLEQFYKEIINLIKQVPIITTLNNQVSKPEEEKEKRKFFRR
jgi:hypothetical protein